MKNAVGRRHIAKAFNKSFWTFALIISRTAIDKDPAQFNYWIQEQQEFIANLTSLVNQLDTQATESQVNDALSWLGAGEDKPINADQAHAAQRLLTPHKELVEQIKDSMAALKMQESVLDGGLFDE